MGIVLILILAVVIVAAAAAATAVHRTRTMRASFGPEYERMVQEHGSPGAADAEARRRLRAHADLQLKTLSDEEKGYYAESWTHVRGDFVDHPAAALVSGDRLLRGLLNDLGYQGENDEQLKLLSVAHGPAVAGYRGALEVVQEVEQGAEEVPTERMRVALAACGALSDELLGIQRRPAVGQGGASGSGGSAGAAGSSGAAGVEARAA